MYDVDAIVYLLPLQEGVQMVEKCSQVTLTVSVGNHNSCVVPRFTVWRTVMASWGHQRVLLFYLLQGKRGRQANRNRTH